MSDVKENKNIFPKPAGQVNMADHPVMNNLKGSCNIGFHYHDGFLFCEDVAVKDVKTALKASGTFPNTPFFLYSKNQIIKNIQSYQKPLAELGIPYNLNYAMKANMNPNVLRLMKECQCSVTLVSGLELRLALEIGFKPEHLLLNGNGKQDWEVELAVSSGCLLNIDSEFNFQQTRYVCKQLKKTASVLLRVTPDIDPKVHPHMSTGQKTTKFGLPVQDLDHVLELIQSEPLIELVGLHCHLGSCIDGIDIFRESAEILVGLFTKMKSKGFEKMKYLNIGGGLALDYKRHVDVNELEENKYKMDTKVIPLPSDLIGCVSSLIKDKQITLIFEPGRTIIANAAILVCTVLGVKNNDTKRFIIIDGSMTEVIRPSLYGAYHHIALAEPCTVPENKACFDVVGPVCESGDFLGKDRLLPTPHEGCLLAVFDVGAYCGSMGSNYNMRVRPAEVMVDGSRWQLIRRPDSFEDIMRPYIDLDSVEGTVVHES